jgi:hypothetical protein
MEDAWCEGGLVGRTWEELEEAVIAVKGGRGAVVEVAYEGRKGGHNGHLARRHDLGCDGNDSGREIREEHRRTAHGGYNGTFAAQAFAVVARGVCAQRLLPPTIFLTSIFATPVQPIMAWKTLLRQPILPPSPT